MQKIKIIFLFLLSLTFTTVAQAQSKKTKGNQQLSIKTSAQCEMCKERIENSLKKVQGVKKPNLNLDNKVLTLSYNTNKTNPDAIKKAISAVGYDADEVVADKKAYDALPNCCKK